ncbi:MAG: hypothetical protein Q9M43_15945 [Sulfurimonas sp.]|nr:hypothetical protein [Sulfurimonas sp.]
MSEISYRQCFKVWEHVSKIMLPALEENMKIYQKEINKIPSHERLNRARGISKAASNVLNNGYHSEKHSSKNIGRILDELSRKESEIKKASQVLETILQDNRHWYKGIIQKNMQEKVELMRKIKEGTTKASELLDEISTWAKKVETRSMQDIPKKLHRVTEYVKKTESSICEEVDRLHYELKKVDTTDLGTIRDHEWTNMPQEVLFGNYGAFTYSTEY